MNSAWLLAGGVWSDSGVWIDAASLEPPVARFPSLLPRNSTPGEMALEQVTGYGSLLGEPVRPLWNPDTCPAHLLPWLAWALSVDEWDPAWSETTQRSVIRASVGVHRRKGTRAAVEEALGAAGYPDAVIVEDYSAQDHDAEFQHDGSIEHVRGDHWAEYRLTLARPVTIAQADQVRAILAQVAPARSHLRQLDFQQVAHIHNAAIAHDGRFSHGAA